MAFPSKTSVTFTINREHLKQMIAEKLEIQINKIDFDFVVSQVKDDDGYTAYPSYEFSHITATTEIF